MPIRPRALAQTAAQVLALVAVWWLADGAARLAGVPVPGGVLGLALVLAMLASGRLRPAHVQAGAAMLLAHLGLFFVPAVVVVIAHPELLGGTGLRLLAVMATGTLLVMAATALTVEAVVRARGADADA